MRAGRGDVLRAWGEHLVFAGLLVAFLSAMPGVSGWGYVAACYGGASLLSLRTFLEHQAAPDAGNDPPGLDGAMKEAFAVSLIGGDGEEFPRLRGGTCGNGDWCKNCWDRFHRDSGVEVQSEHDPEPGEPRYQKGEGKRKGLALIVTTD